MKIFGAITRLTGIFFRKNSNDVGLRANQATTYSATRNIDLPEGDTAHVLVSRTSADTLTNKTLTAPVINSPTGITAGDVGLGNVNNTSDATKNAATATLTNKTLTGPVVGDFLDLTDVSTPVAPGAGKTRVYSKSGNVYKRTATLPESLLGGGSGSGSKNYLAASTATSAGWASTGTATATTDTTAADLPEPSIGTGVLLTLGTAGNYSYVRWTVDPSDYGAKCPFRFALKTLASYASGNAKLDIYSNTASNYGGTSTRLPLTTDASAVTAITTAANFLTYYDAPNATAPYMEARWVTVTATGQLCLSSLTTGPGASVPGSGVGPWLSYTPTFTGFGTPTAVNFEYRVEGDTARVRGSLITGTVTAATAILTLPNSWTSSVAVPAAQVVAIGTWNRNTAVATSVKQGLMVIQAGANNNILFSLNDYSTGASPVTAQLANAFVSSSQFLEVEFSCKIDQLIGAVSYQGQNQVEYAGFTGTVDADSNSNGSQVAFSPAGAVMSALTDRRQKYVAWQSPPQNGDVITAEVSGDSGASWSTTNFPWVNTGTTTTTTGIRYFGTTANVSRFDIGRYAELTTAWSSSFLIRFKKVSSGQAVGFGEVNPGISSGLVGAAGLKGRTDGGTVAAGYVGESARVALAASSATATADVYVDGATTFTLQPGKYAIQCNPAIRCNAVTATQPVNEVALRTSANVVVERSTHFPQTMAAAGQYLQNCPFYCEVNISVATTYKISVVSNGGAANSTLTLLADASAAGSRAVASYVLWTRIA